MSPCCCCISSSSCWWWCFITSMSTILCLAGIPYLVSWNPFTCCSTDTYTHLPADVCQTSPALYTHQLRNYDAISDKACSAAISIATSSHDQRCCRQGNALTVYNHAWVCRPLCEVNARYLAMLTSLVRSWHQLYLSVNIDTFLVGNRPISGSCVCVWLCVWAVTGL